MIIKSVMNVSILNTANRLKIGEIQENYPLVGIVLLNSTGKSLVRSLEKPTVEKSKSHQARIRTAGDVVCTYMFVGFDCAALFDYTGMTGFEGSIPELLRKCTELYSQFKKSSKVQKYCWMHPNAS